jgi:hypothetical protein
MKRFFDANPLNVPSSMPRPKLGLSANYRVAVGVAF